MSSSNSDISIAKKYFQGEIGKSTLINKLNIKSQQELEEVEAYFVENALSNGLSAAAKELSPYGLKQMHKEFFAEIYEWAGTYRTYTTGRGLPFCKPEFIENELRKIYEKLNKEVYPGINKQDFIKISAWFIGELNVIHPFIDGNGRTQRKTLDLISEKADFAINMDILNKNNWYKAAEECHIFARYDGFESIISSLIIKEKDLSQLVESLTVQQIQKNHPTISSNDAKAIALFANHQLDKYKNPSAQQSILEKIHSQLPDIASGKITLPALPELNKKFQGR